MVTSEITGKCSSCKAAPLCNSFIILSHLTRVIAGTYKRQLPQCEEITLDVSVTLTECNSYQKGVECPDAQD